MYRLKCYTPLRKVIKCLISSVKKGDKLKVVLSDGYYLTQDEMNYILKKVSVGKNGNPSESTVGYYCKPEYALMRYVELVAKDRTENFDGVLKEYASYFGKCVDDAVAVIKGVFK